MLWSFVNHISAVAEQTPSKHPNDIASGIVSHRTISTLALGDNSSQVNLTISAYILHSPSHSAEGLRMRHLAFTSTSYKKTFGFQRTRCSVSGLCSIDGWRFHGLRLSLYVKIMLIIY